MSDEVTSTGLEHTADDGATSVASVFDESTSAGDSGEPTSDACGRNNHDEVTPWPADRDGDQIGACNIWEDTCPEGQKCRNNDPSECVPLPEVLVCNNTRHFSKVPGLLVENWT